MYAAFFGLAHLPFSIAPDPRALFLSERHREALAHLLYGLGAGGGIVLLTGEVGTGKTTVCRGFLQQIPAHCSAAYIFNPKLGVHELLATICDEFGIAHPGADPARPTVKEYVDPLNAWLLAGHAAGRNAVLVIDEAQALGSEVLEQLRLLTNLETDEKKLLQIILIGQPELREMVARPELTQLAQRVVARYHLGPLTQDETARYIAHRMQVAGWQGPLPFEPAALARVHAIAGGVPRRINLLCDRALLSAYAAGQRQIDARRVRDAAREVFDDAPPADRPRRWPAAVLGLVVGVLLTALALGLAGQGPWSGAPRAGAGTGAASATGAAPGPRTPAPTPAQTPAAVREAGDQTRAPGAPAAGADADASVTETESGRQWLARELDRAGIAPDASLRARVRQFQRAQGLQADGQAGPLTLARLAQVLAPQPPEPAPEPRKP